MERQGAEFMNDLGHQAIHHGEGLMDFAVSFVLFGAKPLETIEYVPQPLVAESLVYEAPAPVFAQLGSAAMPADVRQAYFAGAHEQFAVAA